MLLLTISILFLMAIVNYRIGNKQLLYPPVVFCAVWAADLILVWVAGNSFYPLSSATLFILLCGGLAFSFGSWIVLCYPRKQPEIRPFPKVSNQLVTLLVVLHVVAIPLCYRWTAAISSGYGSNFLVAARRAALDESNAADMGTVIFGNLMSLSIIVAMIAFHENSLGKKRSNIAIASALVLNLMTGGRAGIVGLLFALVCLDWMKTRRLRWKPLAAMFLIFVVTFAAIAVYLQKGDARTDASFSENIIPVVQGFADYTAGGLVAFDRVVREPNIVEHNWHINRFFLGMMNKLGARFEIPPLGADYVTIGPNSSDCNVFTFYFAYLDFGYVGMMGIVLGLGFLITFFYIHAIRGSGVAAMMYAGLFGPLLLTIFNESLFLGLLSLLRLYVVAWAVYRGPLMWDKVTRFVKQLVEADLAITRVRTSRELP